MRVLLIVMTIASLALLACSEAAPTAEYAKAKAAYQSAFADTADVTYRGARWDEVLTLLKAVPAVNAQEHGLAQQLVKDIESTRARIAADVRASDAKADKLLDLPSLPPLDPTTPTKKKDPPLSPEQEGVRAMQACADACKTPFLTCMAAAGCTPRTSTTTATGGRVEMDCAKDAKKDDALACNDGFRRCGTTCK